MYSERNSISCFLKWLPSGLLFLTNWFCHGQILFIYKHLKDTSVPQWYFPISSEEWKCFGKRIQVRGHGFPGSSDGKESACNAGDPGSIPGLGNLLEKGMATHPSILAWRIPWREEPGELQSMGSQELDTTEWLHFTSLKAVSANLYFFPP